MAGKPCDLLALTLKQRFANILRDSLQTPKIQEFYQLLKKL